MTSQDQEMRIMAETSRQFISGACAANCEECGAEIPVELKLCSECAWDAE